MVCNRHKSARSDTWILEQTLKRYAYFTTKNNAYNTIDIDGNNDYNNHKHISKRQDIRNHRSTYGICIRCGNIEKLAGIIDTAISIYSTRIDKLQTSNIGMDNKIKEQEGKKEKDKHFKNLDIMTIRRI